MPDRVLDTEALIANYFSKELTITLANKLSRNLTRTRVK
jgi:hypothetical protein